MHYWYHFAIMFEALFILTDHRHRHPGGAFSWCRSSWGASTDLWRAPTGCRASMVASFLVVAAWAYFIQTGTISTIWPMFGIANQLLAAMGAVDRHDRDHPRRQGRATPS